MPKINPVKELQKFEKIPTSQWNDALSRYDRETLQALTGLLIIANQYTAKTLSNALDATKLFKIIGDI